MCAAIAWHTRFLFLCGLASLRENQSRKDAKPQSDDEPQKFVRCFIRKPCGTLQTETPPPLDQHNAEPVNTLIKKCPKCRREYETTNTLCPVDGNVLERIGDPLEGQVLADKYRIEERISAGGMGAVYRATHVLMDKKVAVKVLHPALASDDQIVQRFTREARAASRISHPHALNVTDFGEAANGVVFLVMEYLGGRTLKEVLRAEGPLPLNRTVEIFRQITGALDAAHAEGVVHRDLKSDNIMLEEVGGHADWAKVLDFGIAKIQEPLGQDPALTAPNLVIGTPQYMSPEQCSQSSNIDKRSDIYSLGVILYEMLTAQVPFTGESPTAIMMRQLQDAPPSVLELQPALPASVDMVIKRALAKSPDERFDSAGEFCEAFTQAAGDAATIAVVAATADTNRLATTTASNDDANSTASLNDSGEATVVHAPATTPMTMPLPIQVQTTEVESRADVAMPVRIEASPARGMNPWRVMIPAALALVSIIGLVYAFSGNSTSNSTDTPGSLRADPNSQPAQNTTPAATGESERNLPARNDSVAAPATGAPQTGAGAPSSSSGTFADPLPPTDDPQTSPTTNANTETAQDEGEANSDANENSASTPSPTPAGEGNRNSNQRRPPSLTPNTNALPPPPPPPPANSSAPRETPAPSPRRRTGEGTAPQTPAPPTSDDNDSIAPAPASFHS